MVKARAFFFVCAGLFLLALSGALQPPICAASTGPGEKDDTPILLGALSAAGFALAGGLVGYQRPPGVFEFYGTGGYMISTTGPPRSGPAFRIGNRLGWSHVMVGVDAWIGKLGNDGAEVAQDWYGNWTAAGPSFDAMIEEYDLTLWLLPSHDLRLGFGPAASTVLENLKGKTISGFEGYPPLGSGLSWHVTLEKDVELSSGKRSPRLVLSVHYANLSGIGTDDVARPRTPDRYNHVVISAGLTGNLRGRGRR